MISIHTLSYIHSIHTTPVPTTRPPHEDTTGDDVSIENTESTRHTESTTTTTP